MRRRKVEGRDVVTSKKKKRREKKERDDCSTGLGDAVDAR